MTIVNTFKLANGEEIIAKIVETNDDSWVIESPVLLFATQNGDKMGVGFGPWMFGDMKEVKLNSIHVMAHNEHVQKALEDHYLQAVSGIALPN